LPKKLFENRRNAMGYIEQNLMSGETIIYPTKLHWAIFLRPGLWLVLAIYFSTSVAELGGLFFLVAIIDGLGAVINYTTSEFGLTNKRVLMKVGFIRRHSIEVLLSKIEGIQVNQGILGRILGYGSIVVSGTGGMKDPFHKIDKPLEFRRRVQEQIEKMELSRYQKER
jgi:uncharacterized membrane protein YdbT with pleckstrin-like domain